MHPLSILSAFFGGIVLVAGTGENTCTSTAIVSITTDVLLSQAAITSAAPKAPETPIHVSVTIPTPSNAVQSSIAAAYSSNGNFGTAFTATVSPETAGVLPPLTGTVLSSVASAIAHSSYPYVSSFGPGGGISPIPIPPTPGINNSTTLLTSKATASTTATLPSTSTKTSTSSAAATTTSTSTGSGTSVTAAITSPSTSPSAQPASGGVTALADNIPGKGAELALLALVAGVMLML
ncbi:MAG: hypothetical protein Q9181_001458 [Wetmoreana brouardii]